MSRCQTRTVTGLLTGHKHLWKHLHTIGVLDTPMCGKFKDMNETSYHLLCECNSITILRLSVMGKSFPELKDIRNMHIKYILKMQDNR